ncbi:unnamed protein product [Clonostachys rosea]|uniref:Zn(2)-C6 fungal-type domain-containing protein n=1 Tax=Bionectria ochroleuca TaxID=29856 RepID=A0ABY6UTA8_BIOOC|nr:unnamed protein product [Clonostachys rosea]
MARIGHKKSRNGCTRCKERKVKCDEGIPCRACVREGIACSLAAKIPHQSNPNPKSKATAASIQRGAEDTASVTPTMYHNPPTSASPHGSPWSEDLRLMNHYTAVTSATLPGATHEIWQSEVPKEAVTHAFLMHQILAISAFHLGYLNPLVAKTYLSRGLQHQQNAIAGIKAEISHVSSSNCHALFTASSLLFMGAFAASTPAMCLNGRQPINDLLDVFVLLRGLSAVIHSSKLYFRRGILSGFMRCDPNTRGIEEPNPLLSRLDRVRLHLTGTGADPNHKAPVQEALESLQEKVIEASTLSPELHVAVLWPMDVKDEFLALVRQHDPAALVVIAQYSWLLYNVEKEYWFIEGWGCRLATHIAELLSPEWRELASFPWTK